MRKNVTIFWIRRSAVVCLMAVAALAMAPLAARGQHAGDIEIEVLGGKLVVDPLIKLQSIPAHPSVSTDPGFDAEPGTFDEDDVVGFNVIQKLWYWNGTALADPGSTTLTVFHESYPFSPHENDFVVVSGTTTFLTGFTLGVADDDGEIHTHPKYQLSAGAPNGAYGLVLELTSPQYMTSDPFLIVFNRGLTEEEFLAGADAIAQASMVPEPSSLVLAGIGLVGLALAHRRRSGRWSA